MHVCISVSTRVSCFITFVSRHRTPVPLGAVGPLSFSNNITGRSTRPAHQEGRSWWLWNSLILKRLQVPSPRPPGHSLCLHLRTSQPLPPFPASFAEYSFCFVQVVAAGGGGVVRSSYFQNGRSIPGKYISTQKDGSLFLRPRLHLQR